MKDGTGTGQRAALRQDLYDDYVKCYLEERAEVGPCRDHRLLKKAAQYLLNEAEATGAFTVFPFPRALTEGCGAQGAAFREHLSAFIRAAELLETLCVNLFLQPWKKEIKTLKTFTGPFVYCLQPVFSSSTIQAVLASIGYVPHTDPKQCEYRLSEDFNADRAKLIGFELLLARVECYHFLELQEDQLGPQEWLEVLQRRVQPIKVPECTETKTATAAEDEEKNKMKESDKKEVLYLDTRLVVDPPSKTQHYHLCSVDQSIMEMQRTYPDLAIRGRPLLPEKPHKACSSLSNSKDVGNSDRPERDCIQHPKAAASAADAAATIHDGSKPKATFDDLRNSRHCTDRSNGDSCSFSSSERSRAGDELSGPQAISLHLTLRAGAGSKEPSHEPGESQPTGESWPTAEPSARAQQETEPTNESPAESERSAQSSVDEERDLRELAERMGQHCEQENEPEAAGRRGDHANRDRRKKEGETRRRRRNLRKQALPEENGPTLSGNDGASPRAPQCDAAAVKEQTRPSLAAGSMVGRQDCRADGSSQLEGDAAGCEDAGPGEEEQSFVIVGQCTC